MLVRPGIARNRDHITYRLRHHGAVALLFPIVQNFEYLRLKDANGHRSGPMVDIATADYNGTGALTVNDYDEQP